MVRDCLTLPGCLALRLSAGSQPGPGLVQGHRRAVRQALLGPRTIAGFQLAGNEVGRLPGRPGHTYARSSKIGGTARRTQAFTRYQEAMMFTGGQTAAGVMVPSIKWGRDATELVRGGRIW